MLQNVSRLRCAAVAPQLKLTKYRCKLYRFCIQQIKRYVGAIERPGALGDDPSTQEELTELEIDIKGARLLLQGLLRQTNPDFITLLLLGFESQQRDTPNYISNAVRSILHALTSASSQRLGSMHAQAAASSAIKVNIIYMF